MSWARGENGSQGQIVFFGDWWGSYYYYWNVFWKKRIKCLKQKKGRRNELFLVWTYFVKIGLIETYYPTMMLDNLSLLATTGQYAREKLLIQLPFWNARSFKVNQVERKVLYIYPTDQKVCPEAVWQTFRTALRQWTYDNSILHVWQE